MNLTRVVSARTVFNLVEFAPQGLITDGVETVPTKGGDRTLLSRFWAVVLTCEWGVSDCAVVSGGFRGNKLCDKGFAVGRNALNSAVVLFASVRNAVFVSKKRVASGRKRLGEVHNRVASASKGFGSLHQRFVSARKELGSAF